MRKLVESGRETPRIFRECPDLPRVLEPIYQGFFEVDRSEFGSLKFEGMVAVLDEYGVTDRQERAEWRAVWREMYAADEARRERERESKKRPGEKNSPAAEE